MAASDPSTPATNTGLTWTDELGFYEYHQWAGAAGYHRVIGLDEAGRGALAGPVVAAAAYLPPELEFEELNDSKQLSETVRERLEQLLKTNPDVDIAVGEIPPAKIDEINILRANDAAMRAAATGVVVPADLILVDGLPVPRLPCTSVSIVKGDGKCACIAAASVIAKVHRDRVMTELNETYPGYGFARHKGYGTKEHLAALKELGPSPVHRQSFAPVAKLLAEQRQGNFDF